MNENKKGSVLSPFKALKFLGQKPVTIRVPYETRPTAERYRGFHVNDLEKCIGCGACAALVPEIFEIDMEKMKSFVKKQPESEEEVNKAKEAAEACPVNAIQVSE